MAGFYSIFSIPEIVYNDRLFAKVAELVDALDLGSSGATRGSSSLPFRTIFLVCTRIGVCDTIHLLTDSKTVGDFFNASIG